MPEAGLLTVTKVEMTSDLKIAKIYISFLEPKKTIDELLHILIDKKKLIRHYAGLQLKLKYIPELRFYYDKTMVYTEKISTLINKIHQHD